MICLPRWPREPSAKIVYLACSSMPSWNSPVGSPDRKSTRLNSSHLVISYAVFCLKKQPSTTRSGQALSDDFCLFSPQPVDPSAYRAARLVVPYSTEDFSCSLRVRNRLRMEPMYVHLLW